MGAGFDTDLTTYADPDDMVRFRERARVGDWITYAVGPVLNPRHPVAELVRAWIAEASVQPAKKRVDGALHHVVQRCQLPFDPPDPFAVTLPRRPLPAGFATSDEGRLLRFIESLATRGLPMPSGAAIARELGLGDRDRVEYLLKQLRGLDLIRWPPVGRFKTRIVTVVASGRRTADVREVAA